MDTLVDRLRHLRDDMNVFSATRLICGEAADRIEELTNENALCMTLARIREALGVDEKPMMSELPGIVAEAMRTARIEGVKAGIDAAAKILERQWPGPAVNIVRALSPETIAGATNANPR